FTNTSKSALTALDTTGRTAYFTPTKRAAEVVRQCAGVAQSVRVPACHAGGRGFEPRHSRHSFQYLISSSSFSARAAPRLWFGARMRGACQRHQGGCWPLCGDEAREKREQT